MKNSIRIFALVSLCAASLGIMGCSKFLSEEPQSQYSMGTFYKTPSDFEIAIAGVYAGQQDLYNNLGGVFRMAITRSDDTKVGAGYVDQNDKFLDDATTYLGTQLEPAFGGDRCFGVLANMDFILVCTYEKDGLNPELVLYKKR